MSRLSLSPGMRRMAVVLLTSAIVGVTSERMFWYWVTDPVSHIEIALFYAVGVAPCLWAIGRYRVGSLWSLLLVAPVLGYLIEGVVTPVLYEAGPFVPIFPAWFAFWHGIFGLVVVWYLFRRWLLAERWEALLVASAGLGLFWGLWSTTLWLDEMGSDRLVDGRLAPILSPIDFARYALVFSAILALGHWLLGFVWTVETEPHRVTRWTFAAGVVAVVVVWTVFVPWALPMFAAYMGLQVWGLRRHRRVAAGPDLFASLAGRVRVRALWPLVALPAIAAGSYAVLWELSPRPALIRAFLYTVIGVQSVVAVVVTVMALRRARGSERRHRRAIVASPVSL